MIKFLIFLLLAQNLNDPSDTFKKIICEYELESLHVSILKNDLIKGFENFDKIKCDEVQNLSSIIIHSNSIQKVFSINEFEKIPEFLKQFNKGDWIELTLIYDKPFLQRRNKQITLY